MKSLLDKNLWRCLLDDMREPLQYLPQAVLIGLLCAALIVFFYYIWYMGRRWHAGRMRHMSRAGQTARRSAAGRKRTDREKTDRKRTDTASFAGEERFIRRDFLRILVLSLFMIYAAVMLQQAFFSRPPGSRAAVNLALFGTWGRSAQGNAYVVENIIMFIPWGILLTLLIRPFQRNGFLCVLSGFAASAALETVQYLTQRGFCQLDDVVMNTLGAFAGWCLIRIVQKIGSRIFLEK